MGVVRVGEQINERIADLLPRGSAVRHLEWEAPVVKCRPDRDGYEWVPTQYLPNVKYWPSCVDGVMEATLLSLPSGASEFTWEEPKVEIHENDIVPREALMDFPRGSLFQVAENNRDGAYLLRGDNCLVRQAGARMEHAGGLVKEWRVRYLPSPVSLDADKVRR